MRLSLARTAEVVAQLDLTLAETPVCLACLCFVSDARGGRSAVARAIVLRLAAELADEQRRFAELHRLAWRDAPPEWN